MLGDITAAGELYIVTGYTDILRKYLMADETRIQVLKEPERKPETDWLNSDKELIYLSTVS